MAMPVCKYVLLYSTYTVIRGESIEYTAYTGRADSLRIVRIIYFHRINLLTRQRYDSCLLYYTTI